MRHVAHRLQQGLAVGLQRVGRILRNHAHVVGVTALDHQEHERHQPLSELHGPIVEAHRHLVVAIEQRGQQRGRFLRHDECARLVRHALGIADEHMTVGGYDVQRVAVGLVEVHAVHHGPQIIVGTSELRAFQHALQHTALQRPLRARGFEVSRCRVLVGIVEGQDGLAALVL